jgi:N-acetylmuramoyl-L-alanine amidase
MLRALGTTDRGVKTANYSVLRNTNCHAVLIETGFLSNRRDEKILKDEEKQEKLATEVYQAIIENYNDYIPQGGYFYTNEF